MWSTISRCGFFFLQVVIEGVVGPSFLSDIGIDDIIVKDCSLGPGDQIEKAGGQIIQVIPNKLPLNRNQAIQSALNPKPIYRYPYYPGMQIKTLHPIFQKLNIYPQNF